MSDGSAIEWLAWPGYRPASWNPVKGCSRVSEGCRNCYAEVMAARFSKPSQWGHGFAEMRGGDHRWTGRVELVEERLTEPLKWRAPRCIFVNSTSDLFHERLPDEAIDRVFAVMALCPQHLFIVLTKRQERMQAWFASDPCDTIDSHAGTLMHWRDMPEAAWPLPNVILGVSVEDQPTADERIPHLLATPATCRMVSYEPALGPVDFSKVPGFNRNGLDLRRWWVVAGSESGPGARPCDLSWVRSMRNQCHAAGVPFFMKQVVERGRKLPLGQWPADLCVREFPEMRS